MDKSKVDYSLYLVTDSTPEILGSRTLIDQVEAAIRGGVSIVQYRDKVHDTSELVRVARGLHAVTRKYGVPLLINDDVDVAVEVGCEGVHIGQDDMGIIEARRLLGKDKIIGVTAGTVEEALKAAEQGADYLGIGTVFATPTKKDTKILLGPWGLQSILAALSNSYPSIKTVCIGGLNAGNIQRVIFQSTAPTKSIDGIAVVSALISAEDPEAEAKKLLGLIKKTPAFVPAKPGRDAGFSADALLGVIREVQEESPLSHNMTNLVVQNFAANVALAVGASPIMSNYGEEAEDLAKLGGALVINMGTVTPDVLQNYLQALQAYNGAGRPVVFDPVGAGATSVRRAAALKLLSSGYLTIIKGNEGEIQTLASLTTSSAAPTAQQRGVDSSATLTSEQKSELVTGLAARLRNIVILTGKEDFISDGTRTFSVANGHEALSIMTGTGCVLGTTISAFAAVWPQDLLIASVSALVYFGLAAEFAAKADNVKGPGTFAAHFVDELFTLRKKHLDNDLLWRNLPKVRNLTPGIEPPEPVQVVQVPDSPGEWRALGGAFDDHQLQLMLLEQQNVKRLVDKARRGVEVTEKWWEGPTFGEDGRRIWVAREEAYRARPRFLAREGREMSASDEEMDDDDGGRLILETGDGAALEGEEIRRAGVGEVD